MSLNVRVEDVPFAILEMVKARIMAQRQKQQQQQAKPRAPKGPRPQFRRFGASSKAYRRPRPAAVPTGGDTAFLINPAAGYQDGELNVNTADLASMMFSRHQMLDPYDSLSDFSIIDGPTQGTKAFGDSGVAEEPFGFTFASNFADTSLVDMRSLLIYRGYIPVATFRAWYKSTILQETGQSDNIIAAPDLEESDAAGEEHNSYTFEFIHEMTEYDGWVLGNGFSINLSNNGRTLVELRLAGIASVNNGFGSLDTEYGWFDVAMTDELDPDPEVTDEIEIGSLAVNTWHHYALCKNDATIKFYIDGINVITATTSSDYWNQYAALEKEGSIYNLDYIPNGKLPIMCAVFGRGAIVHGLRFTPQALYTGESFTPPTSITELA